MHPFHNDNNAVKLSFDYQIADLAQSFHHKSYSSGGENMSTFGDIGRLRQKNIKTYFNFCKIFLVLLKPTGAQESPLARAQGPLEAQVSYY